MSDDPSALDVAIELGAAFEAHHIDYAIGGALAYGFWGIPRATVDVDINLFCPEAALAEVVQVTAPLGIALDVEAARSQAEADGLIVVQYRGMRVDLFVPSIPFSWEALRTRVRVTLKGHAVWILSAEATAVFKLLFFRAKDVVDLQRLVAVQGARLDDAYVRRWIVDMVGEDDARVARWDRLLADRIA